MNHDRSPQSTIERGKMPSPRYFTVERDRESEKWVGIEGYGLDGEVKTFLLLRNIKGNLIQDSDRNWAANTLAELKLILEVDAAIGPAIDLSSSNPETGEIVQRNETGVYGIYVEIDQRFTLYSRSRITTGLDQFDRDLVKDTLQKANQAIPKLG